MAEEQPTPLPIEVLAQLLYENGIIITYPSSLLMGLAAAQKILKGRDLERQHLPQEPLNSDQEY